MTHPKLCQSSTGCSSSPKKGTPPPREHAYLSGLLSGFGVAALLTLAACGNKESANLPSQVAAKVGSDEISVHQINEVLAQSAPQGSSKQDVQVMSRLVLEKLIDQQLALNQALDAKLNRTPEVVNQIETSRREVLAAAWIKQLANTLPRPTEQEAQLYFQDHPYLFSQRRVFHLQELVTPTQPGLAVGLREYTTNGKSIQDAATWLKSRDIAFSGGEVARSAEQIPLETLPQIALLKDGQTTLVETGTTLALMRLVSSESAPVDATLALPRINQFLMNQRIANAVAVNLKEKREAVKVQYMGEFAAAPETKVVALSAPLAPTTPSANATRDTLDKGVAGLK